MAQGTRERILDAALELFAQKGYEAVTVSEIAQAVGIKAPSLYKHFAGKQQVFDCVVQRMQQRYAAFAAAQGLEGDDPVRAAQGYLEADLASLCAAGRGLFLFFLHDPYASKCWKMMQVEQFKRPEAAQMFRAWNLSAPVAFQSQLFAAFMQKGRMRAMDPEVAALHFYAPVFYLLNLCYNSPEEEPHALALIDAHIAQFSALYMV